MDEHLIKPGGWLLAGIWCSGAVFFIINLFYLIRRQRQGQNNPTQEESKTLKDRSDLDNEFLHRFMDSIPASIYFKDRKSRIVELNRQAINTCNLPREKLLGRYNRDFLPRDQAKEKDLEEQEVMRTGTPSHTEEVDEAGKRWFSTTKVPRYDKAGQVIGTTVISYDITDRKLAEKQVEFERELFRAFMDTSPDTIYFKDREGRFVEVNKTLADVCGVPKDFLLGRTDYGTGNAEWAKQRREEELRIMDTKQIYRHEEQNHSDPNLWTHTTKAPWIDQNGEVIGIFGISADISERKMAEQQMKQERDFFREFMDVIPAGVYFKDQESRIVTVNQYFCDVYGRSHDDLIGTTDFDFYPKKDAEKRRHEEQEIMRTGKLIQQEEEAEFTHVKEKQWFFTTKAPRYDKDGRVIGTFGISLNITEKKRAEAQMEFERGLFRALMDYLPDIVYFKDREGRFVEINRIMVELGGKPKEEILGITDFDNHDKEWAEARRAEDIKVMETREVMRGENMDYTKEGDRWTSVIKAPWVDQNGNVVGIFGLATDITAEKEATQEMMRLSKAVDQLAEAVMITDVNSVIQYVNPAFETISGYSAEEALGKNPSFLKSGKHPASFYANLQETVIAGKTWHGQLTNRRKDGSLSIEDVIISPVFSKDGVLTNYVAVKRDISKEVKLEEQVRQSQKMEAVGQLAGGIAHDFNNLLQVILGYCGILQEDPEQSSDSIQECVGEIRKSGQRAAELTSQLLAFSRKQPVTYETLNPNQEVLHSQNMLKRLIGENIVFETKLNSSYELQGDSTQFSQILLNLVVNANAAMLSGGHLIIQTQDVEFSKEDTEAIPEAIPGRFVCLSVTDTGVGMTEAVRSRIFEPFFTTKGVEGTGMGLAAVYGIVQQHKGWINIYSEPGEGTCLKVYFPSCEKGASKIVSYDTPDDGDLQGHGERILFVEDDDMVRDLMVRALSRVGYDVVETADAIDAQRIFEDENGNFDLLFSDVVLRDLRGTDLADKLRSLSPHLLVLLCSGYTEERVSRDEVEAGEFEFLQKPVSIPALLKTIRKMLNDKKA